MLLVLVAKQTSIHFEAVGRSPSCVYCWVLSFSFFIRINEMVQSEILVLLIKYEGDRQDFALDLWLPSELHICFE